MKKGCLIELLDWTTDIVSVSTPILISLGIPITPQATVVIGKTLKMLLKMGVPKVFKDYQSRMLSPMQKDRLEDIKNISIKTVYELIEKNGWEDSHPESDQYTQYIIEYTEELLNQVINESRQAKRVFLGTYLGSTLYNLNNSSPKWDNVFYLSSLINRLTIRQIILLKLIVNHYDGINDTMDNMICVTNKVAISELKELSSLNMWVGLIGYMPDPTNIAIPLKYMCATNLSKELVESVPIPESLQRNVDDIIKSLELKPYNMTGLPQFFQNMILTKVNNSGR